MTQEAPKKLEKRFHEPKGWRWHSFERNGRKIRFGSAFPEDSIPSAIVVCLPGLSEFSEKYYETAQYCLDHNLAFWVMDWMGQGASGRYIKGSDKRHSDNFEEDIEDLHAWFLGYIKHASVHPDKGRIPRAMLAHSLGAHIGLRYLHEYPDTFECAALSAPFLGIHRLSALIPSFALKLLSGFLSLTMGTSYATGNGEWLQQQEKSIQRDHLSHDPIRKTVHNLWCTAHPSIRVGGVTYKWVHEAIKSCSRLWNDLQKIETPCLIGLAEQEKIVSNSKIKKACRILPNAELLEFNDCYHEILMESDDIRLKFLDKFYELIQNTIIDKPETMKTF